MPVSFTIPYIDKETSEQFETQLNKARQEAERLFEGSCSGSGHTGWLYLPEMMKSELIGIHQTARKIRQQSELLVVIGAGGSSIGTASAYKMLKPESGVRLAFAGSSFSADELSELLTECETKDFSVVAISKSGTTLETALAFRELRALLYKKYGEKAHGRIYTVTDKENGILRKITRDEG